MLKFSQSPLEEAFVQNPYSFYEKINEGGDLIFWEDYDLVFAISHRSVNHFLRDRKWGREVPEDKKCPYSDHLAPFLKIEENSLLEIDPPRHTKLRKLVAKAFTTSSIAKLEPEIELIVKNILNDLTDDEIELQKNFSEKVPVLVIAKLLGVEASMADQLLKWSHDIVAMYQANRDLDKEIQAGKASAEFTEFMVSLINHRKTSSGEDLISGLLASEIDGENLSMDEMVSTCILLLNAGHEATAFALGNGINAIIDEGLDVAKLDDPEFVPKVVEEVLRFDPPLHIFERFAKDDVDVFDHSFKKDQEIGLLLAAANRDPIAFNNPNRFEPERQNPGNVSLGAGVHFCVGAPLARMEMKIALRELFKHFPKLKLARKPIYSDRYHFHGFNELWITP